MVYRSAPGSPGRWTLCWPAGPPSPRAGSCCSDRSPSWLCLGVRPAGGRAASNLKWYNGLILHFIHFLVDKVLWSSTLQMYPLPEAGPREARVGTLDIMHRSAIIWNLVALCWAWNELKLWIHLHIIYLLFRAFHAPTPLFTILLTRLWLDCFRLWKIWLIINYSHSTSPKRDNILTVPLKVQCFACLRNSAWMHTFSVAIYRHGKLKI